MTFSKYTLWAGLRAAGFAVLLSFGALQPDTALAQQTRVSVEDARVLATRLTAMGQPAAAREIALGLLAANPRDVRALVALAQAEMSLGRVSAAERAAQTALNVASTRAEQFIATLAVADVFARTERFTRAQVWLRRAQELTISPAEEQVVANAYRQIRSLNPFSMHLQFGLRPSSNVNSGNSNNAITFAYLPGVFGTIPWAVPADEKPLSGLELSADTRFRYRIAASPRSQTTLDFGLYARTYIMSDSARATAPSVTGESLSYGNLSVGIAHQWVPTSTTNRQFGASLDIDRSFNADGPVSQALTLDFSVEQRLSEADRLSLGLSISGSEFFSSGATVQTTGLRARWSHALEDGRGFATSATLTRAISDDRNRDYASAALAFTYNFGDVLPEVDLASTVQAEWRTFESVSLDPSGRDDLTTSLQLSAGFSNFEVFGFEPVATLRAQRTDSSVPFYDTEGVTLGVTFRSSF